MTKDVYRWCVSTSRFDVLGLPRRHKHAVAKHPISLKPPMAFTDGLMMASSQNRIQTDFPGDPDAKVWWQNSSDKAINMIVGYVRSEQAKAAGVSLEAIKPTQDWSPYMEGDVKAGRSHLLLRRIRLR